MTDRYVMCARAVSKGSFTTEPGKTLYLVVPPGVLPTPQHAVRREVWLKGLLDLAAWGIDERVGAGVPRGDILFFVHGYNNDQDCVMKRHDRLAADLDEAGFKGVVVSYDWSSDDTALNYLEDRHDAKRSAMQLVSDGIHLLSKAQRPDCAINVHLLGHSTGAYVIREAFDDADDARLENNSWMVSQIALIGADVSAGSMRKDNATTDSLYRHCMRLTNYSNLHDSVLKLSNAKRVGMAPRVGRVGMPAEIPTKAVNVDCTAYFAVLDSDPVVRQQDQREEIGAFNHSWHIGNRHFAQDLFETLIGDADRNVVSTRRLDTEGRLHLVVSGGE